MRHAYLYFPGYLFSFHDLFQYRAVNENGAHNKMIITIVNSADRIKGIIYPKKVTGLIKITSHYTYHIIHPKLVS